MFNYQHANSLFPIKRSRDKISNYMYIKRKRDADCQRETTNDITCTYVQHVTKLHVYQQRVELNTMRHLSCQLLKKWLLIKLTIYDRIQRIS